VKRYVVTGAPGAGKTSVLEALEAQGFLVIPEAATELIAREQSRGVVEPWWSSGFVDRVARRQIEHVEQADRANHAEHAEAELQLLDRSLVCTLALERYLDLPPSPLLATALDAMLHDETYQRDVFFVRLLPFVVPSAVRRITYQEAVEFEQVHEQTYLELGSRLIDVPPGPVAERAELIRSRVEERRPG
jgi:predicted ATPase